MLIVYVGNNIPIAVRVQCWLCSFPGCPSLDIPVPKCHHVGVEQVWEEPRKRITARVSEDVRTTLEQAAELVGATINQFGNRRHL